MKKYPLGSALLAGAIALSVTGAMTAVPAPAQFGFGGIVYDPTNYASNVLQAARPLPQLNPQTPQIQNPAPSHTNHTNQTARPPASTHPPLPHQVQPTPPLPPQN